MTILAENREFADTVSYLRKKLKESYDDNTDTSRSYHNLLKLYQKQLVKAVEYQDKILSLTQQLGKTKGKGY
jgi:hypothetical protein